MTESFRPTVLRAQARQALQGKWGQSAIVTLVFMLLLLVAAVVCVLPILGYLAYTVAATAFSFGYYYIFWDLFRGAEPKAESLFDIFKDFWRYLVGALLMIVYTFLWSLLLIVPGIIKGISYGMTPYIMRENPAMGGEEAIKRSMAMMEGHKMDYFLLNLSFIGWVFLSYFTFGIGLLWVIPYVYTASGAFYEELKKDYDARLAFDGTAV